MKVFAVMALFTALIWGQSDKVKSEPKASKSGAATTSTAAAKTGANEAAPERKLKPFVPPPIIWENLHKQPKGVTYANYEGLEKEMSYSEVVKVLGARGEELSSNSLGGDRMVMYSWKAPDGLGNMNVTFVNDKLVGKAQFGLK